MTCICAFYDNGLGEYGMAADQKLTQGDYVTSDSFNKIVEFPNFLVGATGHVRVTNALRTWKPPLRKPNEDFEDYMLKKVVPSLKEHFKKEEVWGANEKNQVDIKSEALLVSKCGIWKIGCDFVVIKIDKTFAAIGSGRDHFVGFMSGALCNKNADVLDNKRFYLGQAMIYTSEKSCSVGRLMNYVSRKFNVL